MMKRSFRQGSVQWVIRCAMIVWFILVAASFYLEWVQEERSAFDMAVVEARSHIEKDLLYRRWVALHGGVYVPPTEKSPPNPFLTHIPERDVVTKSGQKLTLINPAYMTRQVHELGLEQHGVHSHITSTKPLRPENAADSWEAKALQAFEGGLAELSALEIMDGQPFLRFMRPVNTESSCLRCHALQGYRVGDIRGGISASIPFTPYREMARQKQRNFALVHGLLLCLGLFGLWFSGRSLSRSHAALLDREERSRRLSEATFEGICFSESGKIVEVNKQLADILGLEPRELIGRQVMDFIAPEAYELVHSKMEEGFEGIYEHPALKNDGSVFIAEVQARMISYEGRALRVTVIRDITERRRVSDALRDSEKKYRLLAENTTDVVWHLDLQTNNFTYISPSVLKLRGMTPEEVLAQPLEASLTPSSFSDVQKWLAEDMQEFASGRTDPHIELKRVEQPRKDGSTVWTEVSVTYILNPDNRPDGIIGISRDITARRGMEDTLWQAEKRYRNLVNNMAEGVYQCTLDGQIMMANQSLAKILGYDSPGDLILSLTDLSSQLYIKPGARDEFISSLVLKGRVDRYEIQAKKKDGSVIWLSLNAATVPDEEGRVQYLEGTAEDVTERKAAREALQRAKEDWEETFNAVPDLILIIDQNRRISNMNAAMSGRLGIPADKVIGKLCHEIIHGTAQPPVFCPHLRILEQGNAYEGEFFDQKLNGYFHLTVSPLCSRNGIFRGTVHVLRDVTGHKRAEDEAKILQSRLIHADKMKSLGLLVSSVAHEVNNPNNFIMFNSSILASAWTEIQQILDDYRSERGDFTLAGLAYSEMRDAIPKLIVGINDGSHRIKNIVEKLREFAKTDRGSLDDEVDMRKVVQDAAMILHNEITKHTDHFELKIAENIPRVRGNHQQLEQVIINLITNALHALRDRSEEIAIDLNYDASDYMLKICVSDKGCGMAGDVVAKITDPFFTTRLDSGGTGLGLSISKSIIDDHEGTLEFLSEPDCGTTAIVRIPVIQ